MASAITPRVDRPRPRSRNSHPSGFARHLLPGGEGLTVRFGVCRASKIWQPVRRVVPESFEQSLRLALNIVHRRLRIGLPDQNGVDGAADQILQFRILWNARAEVAVAMLERRRDHRQERIFRKQVRVGQLALAYVAASPAQVQVLVDGWARHPLDEGPGRLLLLRVDVLVDAERPAADAIFLRLSLRGRGQLDP